MRRRFHALLVAIFAINFLGGWSTVATSDALTVSSTKAPIASGDILGQTQATAMEPNEAKWITEADREEVEEAKHGLDLFHVDFSTTFAPIVVISVFVVVNLFKPALKFWYVKHVPEAIVLMIVGVILATVLRLLFDVQYALTPVFFFTFLLPNIVSDAGFSMQKKIFFDNLSSILTLAVVGTILSTMGTAALLYAFSGWYTTQISFLHLLLFAALISAVDPVTVLSTFAEIDVNNTLFILIFGESLLNDAVTIVLYRTVIAIIKMSDAQHSVPSFGSILVDGVTSFTVVSFGGIFIGLIGGLLSLTITRIYAKEQMVLPAIQVMSTYLLYLLAESFHFSGILSCVFAAMIISHYMHGNVGLHMEFVTFYALKMLASSCEMIIFVALGFSCISDRHIYDVAFIIVTLVSCYFIRSIVVFSLCGIMNLFRKSKIPYKDQMVIVHSGIRGAVCFGLVVSIDKNVIPSQSIFVTTTLIVIAFTSVTQGFTIKALMNKLEVKGESDCPQSEASPAVQKFSKLDNKYIRPYLCKQSDSTKAYMPNAASFHALGLPASVSSALRLGEDVEMEPYPFPMATSVARPTLPPMMEDEPPSPHPQNLQTITSNSGRRTPTNRQSVYSRHFMNVPSPTPNQNDEEDLNYLTFPAYKPQKDTHRAVGSVFKRARHESIEVESARSHTKKPEEEEEPNRKQSRFAVKTFTVGGDDAALLPIHEAHDERKDDDEKSQSP